MFAKIYQILAGDHNWCCCPPRYPGSASVLLPPAMKLGQGYVLSRVCDSVHSGGVCPNACWDTPPRTRHPSWDQWQAPAPQTRGRYPPWTRGSPPSGVHAGRYGQQVGGMHPTGMQSCFMGFHCVKLWSLSYVPLLQGFVAFMAINF